jgi:hypothetical protein
MAIIRKEKLNLENSCRGFPAAMPGTHENTNPSRILAEKQVSAYERMLCHLDSIF